MDNLYYSEVDSKRFDLRIFRGVLDDLDIESLRNQILVDSIDLCIIRLPSEKKDKHSTLLEIDCQLIHADTLVYYFSALNKAEITPLYNDLSFEIISPENCMILDQMVPVIFKDYTSHYSSNPYLSKILISEGYIEWSKSYITAFKKDCISWLVKKADQIIGFATCSFNPDKKECEGVLYGVMPEASGKGVYTDIIRFTQGYFKNAGYNTMWVSTQIQNYSVQKAWIKEGFQLKKSYDTYHLVINKK